MISLIFSIYSIIITLKVLHFAHCKFIAKLVHLFRSKSKIKNVVSCAPKRPIKNTSIPLNVIVPCRTEEIV